MINQEVRDAILKLNIENSATDQITKIGEGAWHDVYKIERKQEGEFVLRIRKKESYGQLQEYNEIDLITEYETSKAYYLQANQTSFHICPLFFDYNLEESLVFTVESFMGTGKKLQYLSHSESIFMGEKLGCFFRDMHEIIPGIKGFGNIIWDGKQLEGNIQQETNLIWQNDNDIYLSALNELTTTDLKFDRIRVIDKVLKIIDKRRKNPQKISLVNRDVTPENIIFNLESVSIIDPFPRLDFNLKYAGYFVFCYKFLLPAYSNAPRYRKHAYDQNSKIMGRVADGFIKGYIDNNEKLQHRLVEV